LRSVQINLRECKLKEVKHIPRYIETIFAHKPKKKEPHERDTWSSYDVMRRNDHDEMRSVGPDFINVISIIWLGRNEEAKPVPTFPLDALDQTALNRHRFKVDTLI
jgi:hypothetical protein